MVFKAIAASLLLTGSVAVSGVSATAAPVEPYWLAQRTAHVRVETSVRTESETVVEQSRERVETRDRRRVRHDDGDLHLSWDFQAGLDGGVGAEPSYVNYGGGGSAFASASASASASAHASVFARMRGVGGHGGHGGGHHPAPHGCGCKR